MKLEAVKVGMCLRDPPPLLHYHRLLCDIHLNLNLF